MKKKTFLWLIAAAILLIVVLFYGKKAGWFGENEDAKEVEIAKIEPISIIETVSATGKIQPEVEVKLSSEVSGEVIELPIKEGQQVKKGDLLVRINPDLIQAALNQSQAALQNARAQLARNEASLKNSKANYQRNKLLFEKGVISKAEWDNTISDYEMAQANVKSAYYNVQSAAASVKQTRDNLSRTTIFAPMDGTISKLSVELGERVVGTAQMAGTEIVRVANLNNMEVEVDVNETDIVKVSLGDSTKVEVDAYLKREFKGIVTEIANSAESKVTADQVTNFKVKVRILPESYQDLMDGKPENYSPFRPGMTATVDVVTNKKDHVLGVPISAIIIKTDTSCTKKTDVRSKRKKSNNEDKFECIYVNENGKAKLRVVTTGIQDDTNIEVKTGLSEGEEVITGPYNTVTKILSCGDKVKDKSAKKEKDDKASN